MPHSSAQRSRNSRPAASFEDDRRNRYTTLPASRASARATRDHGSAVSISPSWLPVHWRPRLFTSSSDGVRYRRYAKMIASGTILFVSIYAGSHYSLYRVQSRSMRPTYCAGDLLIVAARSRKWVPEVGDVVVIEPPDATGPAVKRVVALSGQKVRTDSDLAVVDGLEVESDVFSCNREDVAHPTTHWHELGKRFEITVPRGAVLVMGDNRAQSRDSRDFGPIGIAKIRGHVVLSVPRLTLALRHCACIH